MSYLIMFVIFVPILIIMVYIPYVTRKTESFGVSIPEEVYHSDELKAIRKRYAVQMGVFGLIVLVALSVLSAFFKRTPEGIAPAIALFVLLIGPFIVYLKFHYQMKRLKAQRDWKQARVEAIAADIGFRKYKLAFSNGWFAIPLIIVGGTAVMTMVFYDQFPNRIPMHYDFEGNVTNWAHKSYRTIWMFPALQIFMTVLFAFINSMIARSRQEIDASNPEKSVQQNVIFRRRWSGFMIIMGTVMVLLFGFIQFSLLVSLSPVWMTSVSFIAVSLMVIGAIVLSFSTGQGGSRVKTAKGRKGQKINRDDDRYWKLGVIYFNPKDPSIWVEKRFGVGWTVNLAHPAGWGFFVVIALIVVVSIALS